MKLTTKLLVATSAAAVLASGCDPQLSGEQGNLSLTYDKGPVAGAVGSSPLAVGAKLNYSAYPKDTPEQKVTFDSAMSDDDAVLRVDKTDGGLMTLEGVGAGEATVDVDVTDADGQKLTDSFDLKAAEVDALEFKNPCAPSAEALYLVDHDIDLHYTMRAGGQIAVGYGYYPVEAQPSDAATIGQVDVNGLLPLHTGTSPGDVTVSSTVDDSDITLTLIEEADINGMEIFEQEFVTDSNFPVQVDKSLALHLLPTVQGLLDAVQDPVPVCQSDIDVQVTNDSPETCEVNYAARSLAEESDGLFHLYEPNALTITGKAEGSCQFTVSLPGADGGNGVSQSFTVDVVKASEQK